MVSSVIWDNHDLSSILNFSQLSNRGKTFSSLHFSIFSTLNLQLKSLTELQEHLSNFGISISTSSSNEGIDTCFTFCIFLNFNFVRNRSLSRGGSVSHSLQSSR